MPKKDGWDVLKTLKSDATLADIPVVMLTIVDEKNKGYTLGASDYIIKPINRDHLLTVIDRYRASDSACRVLVVEDDPDMRKRLRETLGGDGWEVDEAENGRIALYRLAKTRPDLILLDLMMPEMDGFEFLAELRNAREYHHIPVIVVTGADLSEEDHRNLNGGVEMILNKTAYSRDELFEEVRALVAQHARSDPGPVSYTHLTLPTILRV